MKAIEKIKLIDYVKKRYDEVGMDCKTFSCDIDMEITYAENKTIVDKYLETAIPKVLNKSEIIEQKLKSEAMQKEEQEKEKLKIQELQNAEFEKIKNTGTADILEKHFFEIKRLTKALVKAKYKKGCWFYGKGGYGKTMNTLKALAEEKLQERKDFILISGVKSLLSFVKMLDANYDKIILVDDDSISKNRDVANILKQALVGGYIQYESERTKINKRFDGKIILISNDTSENNDIEAVKTRCFTYNFTLSYKQIIECLYTFAKIDKKFPELTSEQKIEMVDYIKDITNEGSNLTLRVFEDGCELMLQSKDWKELLSKLIYPLPEYYLLIQGLDIGDVSVQTGKSTRRLYDIKKSLGLTKLGRNQHEK